MIFLNCDKFKSVTVSHIYSSSAKIILERNYQISLCFSQLVISSVCRVMLSRSCNETALLKHLKKQCLMMIIEKRLGRFAV